MEHQSVAIKFEDLLIELQDNCEENWLEVMSIEDVTCSQLFQQLVRAMAAKAAEAETVIRESLAAAEQRLAERMAGTWWRVEWCDMVEEPCYDDDATYAGPFTTAEACKADCVYGVNNVLECDACPKCGERDADLLDWIDSGKKIECLVCETIYKPATA